MVISSICFVFHRTNAGCDVRPVYASVTAKQASKMLVLVWSLGLLFTAIIANTLSRTVKGQVMLLTMMVMIKWTWRGAFRVSLSTVLFENLSGKFVEFDLVRLAIMLNNEEEFLSDIYLLFPCYSMCNCCPVYFSHEFLLTYVIYKLINCYSAKLIFNNCNKHCKKTAILCKTTVIKSCLLLRVWVSPVTWMRIFFFTVVEMVYLGGLAYRPATKL